MSQPVWTLSVDLVTKTATFQTGMADAAKSARASFSEIRDSANESASGVKAATGDMGYSMTEARHGVMLLGEEFGVHLPRGITAFITSLGPVGAAMEAAFPFLAIILGATLLYEHLEKLHKKADELTAAQSKAADTTTDIFDKLGDKMLQVGIRADELAGNHLDALQKKLLLIDRQTMSGIISELDKLGKEAEAVLSKMESNWFMQLAMGRADVGPAKAELQSMIAEINKLKNTGVDPGNATRALLGTDLDKVKGEIDAVESKMQELRAVSANATSTAEDIQGAEAMLGKLQQQKELYQQNLATLQDMKSVADQSVAIGSAGKKNDTTSEAHREDEEQNKLAEAQQRGLDHRLMIEAAYAKRVMAERKKVVADAEKLAEEEMRATEAVTAELGKEARERAHIAEELGRESAEHSKKMADLDIASGEEHSLMLLALHRHTAQDILAVTVQGERDRAAAQQKDYAQQLAALNQFGKDYELAKKKIEDKAVEDQRASENKITKLEDDAAKQRLQQQQAAEQKVKDMFASGFASVLTGHETFAKMMSGIGNQVASGMIETAIKSIMALNMTKEHEAASAARQGYLAGMKFPFPTNIVMAPMLGAMAFASMMAFEGGGIVPGVERGDVVPARLTPGEGIMPKKLTEGLTRAAESGNMGGGGGDVHFHYNPTQHFQAMDASGFEHVLDKHADVVEKHVKNAFRKGNF